MKDPFQGSTIILHGPPKVGKTVTATSFPTPNIFIATESGHNFIPEEMKKTLIRLRVGKDKQRYKGDLVDFFNGWEKFMWMLDEGILKGILKKTKAKTITVDTVGPLYNMCMDYICDFNKWEHPQDGGHGKGWAALGREFAKGLGILTEQAEQFNCTTLFIAHSKKDEIDAGMRVYSRIEVDLPGQARKILMPAPDHIWYLGFHAEEKDSTLAVEHNRALWLQGTPVVEAGGRNTKLKSKFLKNIPDNDPPDQYQFILKKINARKKKANA